MTADEDQYPTPPPTEWASPDAMNVYGCISGKPGAVLTHSRSIEEARALAVDTMKTNPFGYTHTEIAPTSAPARALPVVQVLPGMHGETLYEVVRDAAEARWATPDAQVVGGHLVAYFRGRTRIFAGVDVAETRSEACKWAVVRMAFNSNLVAARVWDIPKWREAGKRNVAKLPAGPRAPFRNEPPTRPRLPDAGEMDALSRQPESLNFSYINLRAQLPPWSSDPVEAAHSAEMSELVAQWAVSEGVPAPAENPTATPPASDGVGLLVS